MVSAAVGWCVNLKAEKRGDDSVDDNEDEDDPLRDDILR